MRAQNTDKSFNSNISSEIDKYMALPYAEYSINPIEFLQNHANIILSKFFLDYCAIPASQVESERLFSTAGRVFTDRRKSIDPGLEVTRPFRRANGERHG